MQSDDDLDWLEWLPSLDHTVSQDTAAEMVGATEADELRSGAGHVDGVAPPAVPELLDLDIGESPLDFGLWGDFETSWTALCSAEPPSTPSLAALPPVEPRPHRAEQAGMTSLAFPPEVASYCAVSTAQGSAPEDSGPLWYQGVLADMVVPSTSTFDSTHLLPNQGTIGPNILALEGPLDIEAPTWQPPSQFLVIQPTVLRFRTPDVERPTPPPSGSVSNSDLSVVPTAPSGRDVQIKQSKRKSPTEDQRQNLKHMRRTGACVRCRVYRMKYDPETVCANCERAMANAKIFTQPFVRLFLKDVLPFRAGNSRLGQVRSSLPKFRWSMDHPELRKIRISPFFPVAGSPDRVVPFMSVGCRRFVPGPNDVLSESYEAPDGDIISLEFPPFACLDAHTTKTQAAMDAYLDACQPWAEKSIDASITDEIIMLTLQEARRFDRSQSAIIANALKIQSAAYISEIQPLISSSETLGIPEFNNPKFRQHGTTLIPIALDHQLDNLYIKYMQQRLKVTLEGLKKLIFNRTDNREKWYEIFLTIFVLLCNLESVYRSQIAFVRKYAGSGGNIFQGANFTKRTMIEEWQCSAKNLMYHFRVVIRGMIPFSNDWTPEMQEKSGLDDVSVVYIRKVSALVAERKNEIADCCNSDDGGENPQPLLWIGNLFLDG